MHPTKDALIQTVVTLLDTQTIEEITSDQVLEISGISRGSLYHHFTDFSELIEEAQVARFGSFVDASCKAMETILTTAKSRSELIERLRAVTVNTQTANKSRVERINSMAKAFNNPRMQERLGLEQERLTMTIADIYREACEKGWGNPAISPRTVGVFVQAYTVGKAVDDFTPNHIDPENWFLLIGEIIEKVLFPA